MHMLRILTPFIAFILIASPSLSQDDRKKPNYCLRLNGKEDHVDFGNIYRDVRLPVTVSAWVNLDPSNLQYAPVFASRNCRSVYSGFIFVVDRNYIYIQYGDGYGMKHHAFRRGKQATVNLPHSQWRHVAAVVKDDTQMDLYVDGVNAGGEFTGTSTSAMNSDTPDGFASIGYLISNDVEYCYKGAIDDVRVWNRALSPEEVKVSMCNALTGKETGLIGHWTFDEPSGTVCNDRSSKNFDGKLVGSAKREPAALPCVK
jgi:hypothetical protein